MLGKCVVDLGQRDLDEMGALVLKSNKYFLYANIG